MTQAVLHQRVMVKLQFSLPAYMTAVPGCCFGKEIGPG